MMDHAFFVTASYVVSAVALALLAIRVVVSSRNARTRVEALEQGASDRMEGGREP
jgi:heme exporter protein CcmD